MAISKRKAVFTAEPSQLERIQEIVQRGRYRSSSELIREAIDEKLERVRRDLLADQVASYCDHGYAEEGDSLVEIQAFDREE
jgi:Arc/MetJ-type ribon-helix-helix transcriptional regulator